MSAAFSTTLEKTAAAKLNGPTGERIYPSLPINIVDSGASMEFVKEASNLVNITKQVKPLLTAEVKTSYSSHKSKLQITHGDTPVFLSALAVPNFKDNMTSLSQHANANNVLFHQKGVCLMF